MDIFLRRPCMLTVFSIVLVAATQSNAFGQAVAPGSKKLTIPKPETQTFESAGATIQFLYYPGGYIQKSPTEVTAKPGKEVVPIIMVHGFEGRGADFHPLAAALQQQGHAVVVPDMRGHGLSKFRIGNAEITPDKMNKDHFNLMVNDLEFVKKFLYEKNNAGQLNVEMLCLLGADLGGLVATNWIAMDWSRQDLPAFRQGKSAKALVILSPTSTVKGYSAAAAWKHPIFQNGVYMSVMLVAGRKDSRSFKESTQIQKRIETSHRFEANAADRSKQSLWVVEPETDLSGANLVNPKFKLPVAQQIAQFIAVRLAARAAEFPWSERKSPLDLTN